MARYLEIRSNIQAASTAADLARHLLPRQHLGKTIIMCDNPLIAISVVRKNWFKLSRTLQRERASTLNAEKILHLTRDITHMQHMEFVAKSYAEYARADVFFITPDELDQLPPRCFNLYLLAAPTSEQLVGAVGQLTTNALVIDYTNTATPSEILRPKHELEQQLIPQWQKVEKFFDDHHLDLHRLAQYTYGSDSIDEALDVILNTSTLFLRVSTDFLELMQLCQPTHTDNIDQRLYDFVSLLHRRIYALTPGILSQQFAQSFDEDDMSLHDVATEYWATALQV